MVLRVLVVDDSVTVRRAAERALAEAGHEVTVAADGREALEQAQRLVPDVMLIDDQLPFLDGPSLCQALRGIANLKAVPIVLMSARPEHIDDAAVGRAGAVDAIGKPFGPEALRTVVAHAVERTEARSPNEPTSAQVEPSDADVEVARRSAGRRIADAVASALDDDADRILRRVGASRLIDLAEMLPGLLPGERGEASLSSRLDHVPLGELLQLLQHQRQSGVLWVRHGDSSRQVSICLREGLVDMTLGRSAGPEFLLGRYLVEEGLVEREDLDMLLRHGRPRLLGAQLVKLGYITAPDLKRALTRQTCELIYEALRWHTGHCVFERYARRAEAADAGLALPLGAILMEGLRRVDEWRLIEEQVRSFDTVLVRLPEAIAALDPDSFTGDERAVLAAVDGARTVHEIVAATAMSSFDVCKVLFQLMTSRLVKERAR